MLIALFWLLLYFDDGRISWDDLKDTYNIDITKKKFIEQLILISY